MRERVLESVEGLLPRPELSRQAEAGHQMGAAVAQPGAAAAVPATVLADRCMSRPPERSMLAQGGNGRTGNA